MAAGSFWKNGPWVYTILHKNAESQRMRYIVTDTLTGCIKFSVEVAASYFDTSIWTGLEYVVNNTLQ